MWAFFSLRREGSNLRPSGYEPDELPLLYFAMYGVQMYGTNYSKTNKKRKAPDNPGLLHNQHCCSTLFNTAGAAFAHFLEHAISFYNNITGAAGGSRNFFFNGNFYIRCAGCLRVAGLHYQVVIF